MGDLISRQVAIDAFEALDWYHVYHGRLVHGANSDLDPVYKHDDVFKTLRALPPAQPQWIPYEDDTLPEIDEEICVIDIDENVYWTHRTKYSDRLYDPFGNKIKNVVGWFPLPKMKKEYMAKIHIANNNDDEGDA